MAIKPPDDNINKLLELLGVDTHKAKAVHIHIAVDSLIILEIEQYLEIDDSKKFNKKLTEIKKYNLVEVEE